MLLRGNSAPQVRSFRGLALRMGRWQAERAAAAWNARARWLLRVPASSCASSCACSCEFLRVPASSCEFLRVPASSCEFLRVPASSCEFLRVPASSCEFLPEGRGHLEGEPPLPHHRQHHPPHRLPHRLPHHTPHHIPHRLPHHCRNLEEHPPSERSDAWRLIAAQAGPEGRTTIKQRKQIVQEYVLTILPGLPQARALWAMRSVL